MGFSKANEQVAVTIARLPNVPARCEVPNCATKERDTLYKCDNCGTKLCGDHSITDPNEDMIFCQSGAGCNVPDPRGV